MAPAAFMFLVAAILLGAQTFPIGIIDFYGLDGISADDARAALTFKEGDLISFAGDERPAMLAQSEARLAALPGVARAQINLTCCDNGRAIAFVGIEPRGSKPLTFRAPPSGNAHLPADIVKAGEEFSEALTLAMQRGDAAEDRSSGHALNHDPAMRAIQERFIAFAKRDLAALRDVLRRSSEASERALAVQVLAYAPDKTAIVDDLAYAMSDPNEGVRNNGMRALGVIASMTPAAGQRLPEIPAAPFIALLHSPVWSDRNKASLALEALTHGRDPKLLAALRQQALPALAEMARWKSLGHAQMPYMVLARIAGHSDDAALELWSRGERETVIRAALARR